MDAEQVLTESFQAAAEAVPRARTAIAGFAAAHGATGECLDAVRLATSEALTNVIVHAYPRDAGSVHLTAAVANGELWVLVSDDGQGLHARSERSGLGLGLALIAQLCDEFAIARRSNGGTELRMRFNFHDAESDGGQRAREQTSLSRGGSPDAFGWPPRRSRTARAPASAIS